MTRKIKFRGLRTDGKGWVYGDFCHEPSTNILFINEKSELDVREVIPETVGQFTGLKDKNETDIYEGDLLAVKNYNSDYLSQLTWEVFYYSDKAMFRLSLNKDLIGHDFYGFHSLEVIGNIHTTNENGKEESC